MIEKKCTICKKVLSLDFFNKDKNGKYGVSSRCKECHKEYMVIYRRNNRERLQEYDRNRQEDKNKWKKENYSRLSKLKQKYAEKHGFNSYGGYIYRHQYIKRFKPKPRFCTICNQEKRLDLASIRHTYTKNPEDYIWLCRSCHMLFDKCLEVIII